MRWLGLWLGAVLVVACVPPKTPEQAAAPAQATVTPFAPNPNEPWKLTATAEVVAARATPTTIPVQVAVVGAAPDACAGAVGAVQQYPVASGQESEADYLAFMVGFMRTGGHTVQLLAWEAVPDDGTCIVQVGLQRDGELRALRWRVAGLPRTVEPLDDLTRTATPMSP